MLLNERKVEKLRNEKKTIKITFNYSKNSNFLSHLKSLIDHLIYFLSVDEGSVEPFLLKSLQKSFQYFFL